METKAQRTEWINAIISPQVELLEARAKQIDLTQNYKAKLKGKETVEVPEIKQQIEEFCAMLEEISSDALQHLPDFRLQQLCDSLNKIYSILSQLHNHERQPDRTDKDQKQIYIQFFQYPNDASYYPALRQVAWPIIIEATALRNKSMYSGSGLKVIADNVSASSKKLNDLQEILSAAKNELAKEGISKHAQIFAEQSKVHRTNSTIWGITTLILTITDALTILGFYYQVRELPTISIQLSVLILLMISLVSYTIVISTRNYFAEKHNQMINNHKANCLGSYDTFTKSATDEIKSMVLQYTTQTIFSQFDPGFLNKDSIQSPSPVIELLRNVTNEKKSN